MRQLLPGAAFLVVGVATLVAAPLGTVRHFHLNTEWALTLAHDWMCPPTAPAV